MTTAYTEKLRDDGAESGLDYFGARYLSSAQGRFSSPDPIFFQKEMLVNPQRFNLYAYGRNNPLVYIDPSGEKIELTGESDEERKKQLAAIQSAVGANAGKRLQIVGTDGHFTVGITGDVASFSKINGAAKGFADVINNAETAKFSFVAGAEDMIFRQANGTPYTMAGSGADGATGRAADGQLYVYLLRPSECCSPAGGEKFGRQTLGGLGDFFGITSVSADLGTVAGHEFGHALYQMTIGPKGNFDNQKANESALKLENAVRKARDPNAPVRINH